MTQTGFPRSWEWKKMTRRVSYFSEHETSLERFGDNVIGIIGRGLRTA